MKPLPLRIKMNQLKNITLNLLKRITKNEYYK